MTRASTLACELRVRKKCSSALENEEPVNGKLIALSCCGQQPGCPYAWETMMTNSVSGLSTPYLDHITSPDLTALPLGIYRFPGICAINLVMKMEIGGGNVLR